MPAHKSLSSSVVLTQQMDLPILYKQLKMGKIYNENSVNERHRY